MSKNFQSNNQYQQNMDFYDPLKNHNLNENSLISNSQNYQPEINSNNNLFNKNFEKQSGRSDSNENKNDGLNLQNNKFQEIQNLQEQQMEIGDMDEEDSSSYRMISQRKEQRDETQQDDLKQQQQNQYENVGIIYKNEQSIVDLKFDNNQKKFIITKQNLNEKQIFVKEYQKLELLKSSNITLDIVSKMNETYQFEQIAGKTNLKILKERKISIQTMQVFYFVLLNKLNNMHEIGVAHSDIKPENIVLSFDFQPFFIDFGGSILLSDEEDYKDYMNFFTPNYNLKIFFKKYNAKNKIFKPKEFVNKEKIKLCDKVQLSLTFLFLICENYVQKYLFLTKQYNQLFQCIINENAEQNKMIFLNNISRILNQADPEINIVQEIKEQVFEINLLRIYDELYKSNDIIFVKKNQSYKIQHIDKFNIRIINFLDKMSLKLEINPRDMKITPLPDMEEYKNISQKYKIDEYFQKIFSEEQVLYGIEIFNICQYVKVYKIKNLDLIIRSDTILFDLFQMLKSIKLISPFELKFKLINNFDFSKIITYLIEKEKKYCVQSIELFSEQTIKKVIGQLDQKAKNPKIDQIDVVIHLKKHDYFFEKEFDIIRKSYEIKQLKIFQQTNIQAEKEQNNESDIYLEQSLLEKAINQLVDNCNFFQIEQTKKKKIIIQIFDLIKIELKMWNDIQNILESKCDYYIEIIVVNCQFSIQLAQTLKNIYQKYKNKVQYEFKDSDINFQNNNGLKYYINVENNSQQLIDVRLKILFQTQKPQFLIKPNEPIIQNIQQTQSQNILETQQLQQQQQIFNSNNNQNIQLIFKDYTSQLRDLDLSSIQQIMKNEFKDELKVDLKEELKIEYGQQMHIQRFRFLDKRMNIVYTNDLDLQQNIDFIINDIKKYKNIYQKISFQQKAHQDCNFNYFKYLSTTKMEFDSESIDLFYQLSFNLILYNRDIDNLSIYRIESEIKYKNFKFFYKLESNILELGESQKHVICFFGKNKDLDYINKQQKQENEFRLLSYSIEIINKQCDQTEIYNDALTDYKNHFQKYSTLNKYIELTLKKQILLKIDINRELFEKENLFKIVFNQIETSFPQNKIYSTHYRSFAESASYFEQDSPIIKQTLQYIYETLKTYQFEQKLYFDLYQFSLSYDQIKQFINKFNELNSNQYIFRVDISNHIIVNQIQEDFSQSMEICYIEKYLTLQKKVQNPSLKINSTIVIRLKLKDEKFQQQSIKKSSTESDSSKINEKTENQQQIDKIIIEQLFDNHQLKEYIFQNS